MWKFGYGFVWYIGEDYESKEVLCETQHWNCDAQVFVWCYGSLSFSNNYLNFVLNTCYFLISLCLVIVSLLLIFSFRTIVVTNIMCLSDVSLKFIYDAVTMQAQKEVPPDMQCRDKFLLQSVVASPGAAAKDITPEMVLI